MTQLDRHLAILSRASNFRMMRPDEDTLDALSDVAGPTEDFAALVTARDPQLAVALAEGMLDSLEPDGGQR